METCDICGRPVEGEGMFAEAHADPFHADDCYRLGYEREKARADAMEVDRAREKARGDALHAAAGKVWVAMENEYPCYNEDIINAVQDMLRAAGYMEPTP